MTATQRGTIPVIVVGAVAALELNGAGANGYIDARATERTEVLSDPRCTDGVGSWLADSRQWV